jgi:TPR repeat protein
MQTVRNFSTIKDSTKIMANKLKPAEEASTSLSSNRGRNVSDQFISQDKDSHILEEVVSDLIWNLCCPITRELPIEPIIAADGRVYEQYAIEAHISEVKMTGGELRSPVTNEKMSEVLTQANFVKNSIHILVNAGTVEKERGREWTEMVNIKKKAENGDPNAMYSFALFLEHYGIILAAKTWYLKGAALDNTLCMAYLGSSLETLNGYSMHDSAMYLGIAAERGSDVAAYWLGKAFFNGKMGLSSTVNECHTSQASKWLTKFMEGTCSIKHFTDERSRKRALTDASHLVAMINCKRCKAGDDRRLCVHTELDTQTGILNCDQEDDDRFRVNDPRVRSVSLYSPNTRTHYHEIEIID